MPNIVGIVGSDLEIKVYTWLVKHGFRPDIDFEFQSHLIGGYNRQLGDAIVDFILMASNIVLRVQGTYWHESIQESARDKIQKERLQALGYVVVDIWQADITNRLSYTMEQAIQGIELPSQSSGKYTGEPRKGRGIGIVPIPGRVSGPNTIQGDLIDVLTQEPSGISAGNATLNGKLLHDGGMNCKCRFLYDEAKIDLSLLCYLFPWQFYSLINLLTPNIPLDFAGIPTIHGEQTAWQEGKRAGDEFSQALTGLTPTTFYSYKANAKNDVTEDEGESKIFSQ